ncbi:unnamed protein product [Ambrosiozyma monospora]|uniref:Unnamed protein product n=1 Tax=Ambrosiozyma monospora TaxID=43982 RepID=A0ACB5ST65_AMBMO|nr:unnamed protein product [Ambrosiozyma monospora]
MYPPNKLKLKLKLLMLLGLTGISNRLLWWVSFVGLGSVKPKVLLPEQKITSADGLRGTPPLHRPQYLLSVEERNELLKQVDELLGKGHIRESKSPYNSQKGYYSSRRKMVLCDFIIKNRFPLPLIDKILDAKVFSKLNLVSGYHQIRMKEEDVPKTAFSTPLGNYEWLVMPFGASNAVATFQTLMNKVLAGLIGKCCFCFLDDI